MMGQETREGDISYLRHPGLNSRHFLTSNELSLYCILLVVNIRVACLMVVVFRFSRLELADVHHLRLLYH
jgi:hypothetical protein